MIYKKRRKMNRTNASAEMKNMGGMGLKRISERKKKQEVRKCLI